MAISSATKSAVMCGRVHTIGDDETLNPDTHTAQYRCRVPLHTTCCLSARTGRLGAGVPGRSKDVRKCTRTCSPAFCVIVVQAAAAAASATAAPPLPASAAAAAAAKVQALPEAPALLRLQVIGLHLRQLQPDHTSPARGINSSAWQQASHYALLSTPAAADTFLSTLSWDQIERSGRVQ